MSEFCAWCDEPAVTDVMLEPARFIKGKVVDRAGRMIDGLQVVRPAIVVSVCEKHREIPDRKGGTPIPNPRRRKAKDVDQLTIFDIPGAGPKSAIHKDT